MIGQAKYDGGRVHRAAMIQAARDDFRAVVCSSVAAGIVIGLMLAAIFGGK